LIEKRANGKVAEVWRKWLKVRDGKPWEGAHPSRTICGQGKPGKPPSSGLRLAQVITAPLDACAASQHEPLPTGA